MKLAKILNWLSGRRRNRTFTTSTEYWERRYASGGNSGAGSYNHLAEFKADVVNSLVKDHKIRSVIEFGCGDGNQLTLADYPEYLGIDVSIAALETCRKLFCQDDSKRFIHLSDYALEKAEMALSLDVIYHLVEDELFSAYMEQLFLSAERLVVIYSSNTVDRTGAPAPHIRHREFTNWIAAHAQDWKLVRTIPNRFQFDGDSGSTTFSDFYVYAPTNDNLASDE